MIERDYDKLIGRFKELSDNPKLDYHPEDWTAVEQMLDNRDPKRPLLWLWLSGFLLISAVGAWFLLSDACLLYTSPSPRDKRQSRMPSSA